MEYPLDLIFSVGEGKEKLNPPTLSNQIESV